MLSARLGNSPPPETFFCQQLKKGRFQTGVSDKILGIRYFPDWYLFSLMPSNSAVRMEFADLLKEKRDVTWVTLITPNGNQNNSAKVSAGTAPMEYDLMVVAVSLEVCVGRGLVFDDECPLASLRHF